MTGPVTRTIEVPCPPETAFTIFTRDLSLWWPKDKHSVSAMDGKTAEKVVLEPWEGGKLIETGHDGNIHHWGTVKSWEPFSCLELLWHIGEPVSMATHVRISFVPSDHGTKVTLVHSGWEVLGEDAGKTRAGYDSGWVGVFEIAFVDACKRHGN